MANLCKKTKTSLSHTTHFFKCTGQTPNEQKKCKYFSGEGWCSFNPLFTDLCDSKEAQTCSIDRGEINRSAETHNLRRAGALPAPATKIFEIAP